MAYSPVYRSLDEELAAADRERRRLDEARVEAILDWEKAVENVARIKTAIKIRDAMHQTKHS